MKSKPRPDFRPWLVSAALFFITVALFSPLFHYAFLTFDDQLYVTENPHVLSGLNARSIAWAFQASTSGNWLPVTWFSHMLDSQVFALNAGGHHFTNVLLHALNSTLLFLFLRKLTGALWRSAAVAALFAWHPMHVESVAWIAERKDVLSAFFFFLTLIIYLFYAEAKPDSARRRLWYVFALLCFAAGLMAKSMLVTVPFVLLLLDYWPLARLTRASAGRVIAEKIPWLALSIGCCMVTIWAQGKSGAVASSAGLPLGHRLGHVLASYFEYVRLLLFPHHLAIYYPYPAHESVGLMAAGLVMLGAVTLIAFAVARREPWVPVGWLWFVGMLIPVIGLVQVGDQAMADRYSYLPSIGFFMVLVWGAAKLAPRFPALPWIGAGVIAVLAAATWMQLHYWKDTRTLFTRAVAVTKENYLALTLLGSIDVADGDLTSGMNLYREALADKPNYPEAHFFYGRGLEESGDLAAAQSQYENAIRLNPKFEPAHIFLGLLLAKEHHFEPAADEYQTVLRINPRSAPAHNDLARLLQTEGRLDESIQHYRAAIEYDSSVAQAHNNLGVLYLQRNDLTNGVAELQEALRLSPTNAEAKYNLSLGLLQEGQWEPARHILAEIVTNRPNDPKLHFEDGVALSHTGKTRDAMSEFAQALLLTPDYAEALDALAWIAATDPDPALRNGGQAIEMAGHACDLTHRKDARMLLTLAAAFAEAGDFKQAETTLTLADLASHQPNAVVPPNLAAVKRAIQNHQPFRDRDIDKNFLR